MTDAIDKQIIEYYRLCSVGYKPTLSISSFGDKLNILLTNKEVELYLDERNGVYVAKESVIGGHDTDNACKLDGRSKVIVL